MILTNDNCDPAGQYLKAAADLIVQILEYMVAQWAEERCRTQHPDRKRRRRAFGDADRYGRCLRGTCAN